MTIRNTILTITLFFIFNGYSDTLQKGMNSYQLNNTNKKITVWYNLPKGYRSTSKVLFVMHGVKRNGKEYLEDWLKYSNKKKVILIVPEFSNKEFPGSANYNLANIADPNNNINPTEKWHFSIIESVFQDFKKQAKLKTPEYYLYGHSAGAQFAHRFAMFYPESSLKLAISANAGWYTFPDQNISFPYGIKELNYNSKQTNSIFEKKLIILLGTSDTDPKHKYLRNTPETTEQGKHRFERGQNFYKSSKSIAKNISSKFNWSVVHAKRVGHSNSGMLEHAIKLIR